MDEKTQRILDLSMTAGTSLCLGTKDRSSKWNNTGVVSRDVYAEGAISVETLFNPRGNSVGEILQIYTLDDSRILAVQFSVIGIGPLSTIIGAAVNGFIKGWIQDRPVENEKHFLSDLFYNLYSYPFQLGYGWIGSGTFMIINTVKSRLIVISNEETPLRILRDKRWLRKTQSVLPPFGSWDKDMLEMIGKLPEPFVIALKPHDKLYIFCHRFEDFFIDNDDENQQDVEKELFWEILEAAQKSIELNQPKIQSGKNMSLDFSTVEDLSLLEKAMLGHMAFAFYSNKNVLNNSGNFIVNLIQKNALDRMMEQNPMYKSKWEEIEEDQYEHKLYSLPTSGAYSSMCIQFNKI